jgi:hypothetical protein
MSEEVMYVDESGREVQPQQGGQSLAPPMAMPQTDKADLLEKIRPDLIVEIIRNRLLGKELINGVWVTQEFLQERALTEEGAWDIANLMIGVSSQNVSISKLKDDEIRERALSIAKTAQYMCLKNWKRYGIKGADQLYFIHELVFSNTFITLKQPEGEGIRKMLMGTITEQSMKQEDNSRKGGFSLFPKR